MFGTMSFSEKISFKKEAVAKQILYLFYRKPHFLTVEILNYLITMCNEDRLEYDEDYNGFHGEVFNPEPEMEVIFSEFESNESFYQKCVKIYQEHHAFSLLNVPPEFITYFRDNYKQVQKDLKEYEILFGKDSWTSVSNKLVFDCYNGKIPMDIFRLVSSVKSVLNRRSYNNTFKSVILCRMFGSKNMKILNELLNKNLELKIKYDLLTRRRQWERLINSAMEENYISYFSTGRIFYVSTSMTREELQNDLKSRSLSKIKMI